MGLVAALMFTHVLHAARPCAIQLLPGHVALRHSLTQVATDEATRIFLALEILIEASPDAFDALVRAAFDAAPSPEGDHRAFLSQLRLLNDDGQIPSHVTAVLRGAIDDPGRPTLASPIQPVPLDESERAAYFAELPTVADFIARAVRDAGVEIQIHGFSTTPEIGRIAPTGALALEVDAAALPRALWTPDGRWPAFTATAAPDVARRAFAHLTSRLRLQPVPGAPGVHALVKDHLGRPRPAPTPL